MCELFGVSSSVPVGLTYALPEFAKHGGLMHRNKSGWGIAYRMGKDAIVVKEAAPASDSAWVRFIESHPIHTECAIAHVRYATQGEPSYANTHPFARELGGRLHVFAHNGGLKDIWDKVSLQDGPNLPIGQTDSEYAFCVLLERLKPLWRNAGAVPKLHEQLDIVAGVAAELRPLGSANFLYSNGETLIAHAHQRSWEEKDGFSAPRPPGLSLLRLDGRALIAKGLHMHDIGPDAQVAAVASVPLTEDGWEPLPANTIVALEKGREVARVAG